MTLTPARRRALEFHRQYGELRPRHLAYLMWPDSPGWKRRGHRHDGKAGGAGASMWLKAGQFQSAMWNDGLLTRGQVDQWAYMLTPVGRQLLEQIR